MASAGSVTHWLRRLQAGDPAAAQPLWERYFRRLVGLARAQLRATPRRAADEEDVALSAFDSFCRAAEAGRFAQLCDRDGLWPLLVAITAHKARDLARHEGRQKRAGAVLFSELHSPEGSDSTADGDELEQLPDPEPNPALAALVAEECRRLLERLEDDTLRQVALLKMEGYTDDEVAGQLGCARRTVVRKLQRIRYLWTREDEP